MKAWNLCIGEIKKKISFKAGTVKFFMQSARMIRFHSAFSINMPAFVS